MEISEDLRVLPNVTGRTFSVYVGQNVPVSLVDVFGDDVRLAAPDNIVWDFPRDTSTGNGVKGWQYGAKSVVTGFDDVDLQNRLTIPKLYFASPNSRTVSVSGTVVVGAGADARTININKSTSVAVVGATAAVNTRMQTGGGQFGKIPAPYFGLLHYEPGDPANDPTRGFQAQAVSYTAQGQSQIRWAQVIDVFQVSITYDNGNNPNSGTTTQKLDGSYPYQDFYGDVTRIGDKPGVELDKLSAAHYASITRHDEFTSHLMWKWSSDADALEVSIKQVQWYWNMAIARTGDPNDEYLGWQIVAGAGLNLSVLLAVNNLNTIPFWDGIL